MDEETMKRTGDMWALGDYARVAERLRPAADLVAATVEERLGPGQGRACVDIAAGTGSLSVALARAGWSVSSVDISSALIDQGRAATIRLGLDVTWHHASMDSLPNADGEAALVASSFGLIFSPAPDAVVAEAQRVTARRGGLVFSAWTPSSYIATMTELMGTFLVDGPPPSTFTWGDSTLVSARLEPHYTDIEVLPASLPWVFGSPREASDWMFAHSPGHVASLSLAGERSGEMRRAVERHLSELSTSEGDVAIDADYVVVSAVGR